jgi:DNA-directed RNA polymerase subunit H (RpoH/RPB5)
MVPPHRPVTRAYVRKQMSSVPRLAISELPKIRLCDPVVRYLGLRTGQVVAIQRGPHEEAYRVVVP